MKDQIEVEKHILVPKHTLLKEDEAKKVLSSYNVTLAQLPKISKKDPAISDLDINISDVIKIVRKSGTAGKSIYYRAVIEWLKKTN